MAIGVFDSGLGGLSVLRHLKQQIKHESFIYVADSANAPYGDKSEPFIQQRCLSIADFLSSHNVSALVVACNTATAAAVELIRNSLDIPVVAIEPALKPASLNTKIGKVGVLATASTLQSEQYKNLLFKFTESVDCYEQAAHGLVEQVEAGQLDNIKTQKLLRQYLDPMLKEGVDSIVLGCTHYPFLLPEIKKIVGDDVEIIDTGAAVAEQLSNVLSKDETFSHFMGGENDRYFTSADKKHAEVMVEKLLGLKVKVESLPV
jgi:glutamate racemase